MLKSLEINGFKSFSNKSQLAFDAPISAIVGPNGSGKSNAAEAFRFVLGEQSLKALRARHSDELLFNGGIDGSRRNRAHVKAVFDNSNDLLDIEYEEVVVERIIQRGDASTYRINGSQVRLKDVIDLLSDANIGTSRHHIISQGEADRILNVHEKDRKSIIEDALGLRRFYRRRREAVRKLEKTEENLHQVSSRRRDLLPELKFLDRQKKRIDETKKLRQELTGKYQKFFKRESILHTYRQKMLNEKLTELKQKKTKLSTAIKNLNIIVDEAETETKNTSAEDKITRMKHELQAVEKDLQATAAACGNAAGRLETLREQLKRQKEREPRIGIKNSLFIEHKKAFTDLLTRSDTAESSSAKLNLFPKFRQSIKAFLSDITESAVSKNEDYESDITDLEDKKAKLIKKKGELEKQKQLLEKEVDQAEESQQKEQSQRHEAEKELVELKSKYENVIAEENRTEEKQAGLVRRREQITDEQAEARILCGQKALETNETPLVDARGKEVSKAELIDGASSQSKREFYRQLERLKIKLEDTRVSDQKEVLQEYERVQSQVDFLETEVEDLRSSKNSLLELIADIEDTVAKKFDEGIESINDAFGEFFTTMFGGGSAKLFITKHPKGKKPRVETLVESLDETERGVAITVQLPNKKIRGLGVLSGGERSLVSIALLFALSQINPPPFVVLDEADAALDEANSRRFGDMIDRLSNRSQLIIITHNRETMSRADVLYGVTMDQAGGSRLLSLNFSEAVDTVKS